jgi:Na+/melibiose symporter-like transporter
VSASYRLTIACTRTAKSAARSSLCFLLPVMPGVIREIIMKHVYTLKYFTIFTGFIPSICFANNINAGWAGFIEIYFLLIVMCPLLGIESCVAIVFTVLKKFKNKRNVRIFNIVTFILVCVSGIVLYMASAEILFNDVILMFLGIVGSSFLAVLLPNLQYKMLNEHV